ncbi:unnamed protein product [Cunninghamella blakesleeana]
MHAGNQCRIRHIKAIIGRGFICPSNSSNNINEIHEVPNLSSHINASNSPSPSTSTTIVTPPTNNNITFTPADNNTITKRLSGSFSKQNQYVNNTIENGFNNIATPSYINKLNVPHSLPFKDTNNNYSNSYNINNNNINNNSGHTHMMQRSESTSSLQSCNSSVGDSSLTKNAYKANSKRLEHKGSFTANVSVVNNHINDNISVSTIDDYSSSILEKGLLDTYLTISTPILPQNNIDNINDVNDNNNSNHNDGNANVNNKRNNNNNKDNDNAINRDHDQTNKKDASSTNFHINEIMERPLYTSEIIPNSTNPVFRTDLSMIDWYDGVQTIAIIKIWARHSIPESASLSKQMDPTRIKTSHLQQPSNNVIHNEKSSSSDNIKHPYSLIIEWVVDMNELVYVGKTLKYAYSWPNNTILFKLENGYYTAPDVASMALGQSKRYSYSDSHIEADNTSLHSVQSLRTKKSYTYDHIMKLNTFKERIFNVQNTVNGVQKNINDLVEQEKEKFRLLKLRSQKETRLKELNLEVQEQSQILNNGHQKIEEFKKRLEKRKLELKRSQERFYREKNDLESNEEQLEKNIKMHHDILTKLNQRKKELIADLFAIYPIEQSFDDFQQFRIRGIFLPNSVYTGCNDESIATALGFTAHLVNMLAFYLSIPLRYPIDPMGSRSTIHDPVSLINGSRTFPLYGKGVDKYRFEFGVFLLNKNIEQMMNSNGLIVMDLRHTLPNIHYFIQSVLTTSVTSGPTSLSVLSISSYAQGKDYFEGKQRVQPSRSIDLTSTFAKMKSDSLMNRHKKNNSTKTNSNSSSSNKSSNNIHSKVHKYNDEHEQMEDEEEHGENHLTLQPTIYIPVGPTPSPTVSTQSISRSPKLGVSADSFSYTGVHLSSPIISVPAYLDTVTTSSCQKPTKS